MEKVNKLVKKSNESIEYKMEIMTNQQLKIMNLIISMIDNNLKKDEIKKDDLIFQISRKELLKELEISNFKTIRFEKEIDKLTIKRIQYKNGNDFEYINIFSFAKYKNNILSIGINEMIIDYFIDLKKNFTQYYFKNIVGFKSKYSLLFYELLKKDKHTMTQHNHKKDLIYDLEYLFEKLQIESKSMKIYQNFKVKVLEMVKREINNQTDICFEYKPLKSGHKVDRIQITRLYNKKDIRVEEEEKTPLKIEELPTELTKEELLKLIKESNERIQSLESSLHSERRKFDKLYDNEEEKYLISTGEIKV